MRHTYLGRSGLKVSELCLGAMTFGRETNEPDATRILDRYADAGGNFIDTANVYAGGESERILGRWLKGHDRDRYVIATKVRWPTGNGMNDAGLSRTHILRALDASLSRLDTDHVDVYYLHGWDPATDLEETLSTLDTLVRQGRVRYVGISNFGGHQLQRALDLARAHGWERPLALQPQYSLLCRSTEWELLPVARTEGLGVMPWSPLKGGWLTGKYTRDMTAPPAGTRVDAAEQHGWAESWTNIAGEHTWQVVDTLGRIAEQAGRTPAQIALRWVLQQRGVTSPIVGVRTLEHLEGHLGALDWTLDDGQMAELTAASDVPLPYPYDFVRMGVDSRQE